MKRVLDRWVAPVPAARLAILRVAVGAWAIATLVARREGLVGAIAVGAGTFQPTGIVRLLPGPLDAATFGAIYDVTLLLAVAWTLGLGWRAVAPAFSLALLFVLSYRVSFGVMYHHAHVAMLHVIALSCAPAASLRRDAAPVPGWPARLMCVIVAVTYFQAGWSKVHDVGWAWASGDNLAGHVAHVALARELLSDGSGSAAALWMLRHADVLAAAAAATLLLELGAPLMLVHRRIAYAWALALWGMHLAILAIMDIDFRYYSTGLIFLCFLPIERIAGRRSGP
jgi:hypothetical protein